MADTLYDDLGFCEAIELLQETYNDLEHSDKEGAASKVGRQILMNAGQHLFDRCYCYLRGKEQTDEQKLAEAMVKNLALDLGKAAIALLEAAQQLKRAGLGYEAGEAYNAHCADRDAATGILGNHLEAEDVDGLVAIEPFMESLDRLIQEFERLGSRIVETLEGMNALSGDRTWWPANSNAWLSVTAQLLRRHRWQGAWWGMRRAWRAHCQELGL